MLVPRSQVRSDCYIAFSMIPVIGVIPDIVTLVTEPGLFIKALSIIGIVGSLGDLLAIIPGAQPVAAVSAFGDASSAVLKALVRAAPEVENVLNSLASLRETFDVAIDLVARLIDDLQAAGEQLIDDVTQLTTIIENFLQSSTDLWDSFTSFVMRVGAEQLVELGFTPGSQLVGHVLQRGVTLSDDTIPALARLGDDLTEADVVLRDEAAEGLARLTDDAGKDEARRFLQRPTCFLRSMVQQRDVPTFAQTQNPCEDTLALKAERGLDIQGPALDGLDTLVAQIGKADADALITRLGARSDEVFRIVGLRPAMAWNPDTIEGLARTTENLPPGKSLDFLDNVQISNISDETLRNLTLQIDDESLAATLTYLRNVDLGAADNLFNRVDDIEDVFQWRATGNDLAKLDDVPLRLRREDITAQEFQQNIDLSPYGDRRPEGLAVEGAIYHYTQRVGGYNLIYRQTAAGGTGPDIVMQKTDGTWVIIESKGTETSNATGRGRRPLHGALFDEPPTLGRQGSRDWIINDSGRYTGNNAQLRQMVTDIEDGKPYEYIVSRGAFTLPNAVDDLPVTYGNGMSTYVDAVDARVENPDWTMEIFVFRALN